MSRSRSTDRRITRRRKILKLAKGFRGRRGTNFKAARDAVRKSLVHSYEGRKDKKGDMRGIWITRINAAVRAEGLSYSKFINGMAKAGIIINRKALSNMAIEDPVAFKAIVDASKKAIGE
ncbi:MAG: 50S ribosomal protein L20 [Treponema sp.]